MDPNALLARMLELCEEHSSYGWLPTDEAEEVVESFKELHRWILSGGFLPAVWADKIKPASVSVSDDPWQNTRTAYTPPF